MVMRNQPTLFIQRLWDILNKDLSQSISWSSDGLSFLIKDQHTFQEQILATNFNHSNYSSFIRQLNMYSFKKIRKNKVHQEFHHELFRKNYRELLVGIKRKASQQDILYGKRLLKKAGLCPGSQPFENSDSKEVVCKNSDSQIKQVETILSTDLILGQSPCSNTKITTLWDASNMNRFCPLNSKDNTSQLYPNKNMVIPNQLYYTPPIYSSNSSFLMPRTFQNPIFLPANNYPQMIYSTPYYSPTMNLIQPQMTMVQPNSLAYISQY